MPWRGRRPESERRPRPPRRRWSAGRGGVRGALLLGLAASALGCAKEEPPPGSLPDQAPPEVASFRPPLGSVQPDLGDGFRVRFNEPIRENRGLARSMTASPAYRYRVSFGFSTFDVRPEEGWRPAVYRFVFPPPFTDVLGNRSEDTITAVFSTGPPVTETRVAGRLRDRVTGRPVEGGRAVFLSGGPDSVPYSALAGPEGTFVLPSVPPDSYSAYGFEDLNANLSVDPLLEPVDSAGFVLEGETDSVYLDLLLVEPDTTPPVLYAVRSRDSTSVLLTFDDPIDPDRGLEGATVAIEAEETGTSLPVTEVALARDTAPTPTETPPGAVDIPADGATGRGLPIDALAVPPLDTVLFEAGGGAGADSIPGDSLALPDTLVAVTVGRAFEAGERYRVTADGFRNLQHLAGGGDTTFVWEPADSLSAAEDTVPAGSDTVPSAPETVPSGAEAPAPAEDSLPAPGDTVRTPVDSVRGAARDPREP